VPAGAGLAGVLLGARAFDMTAASDNVSLDSHARYLSGLPLGVGLAFWTTLKDPEAHTTRDRLLGTIVVTGGLARLRALPRRRLPMRLALAMELAVTPAICLWQGRLARRLSPVRRDEPRRPRTPGRSASPAGG
jgi:hypothetical protein